MVICRSLRVIDIVAHPIGEWTMIFANELKSIVEIVHINSTVRFRIFRLDWGLILVTEIELDTALTMCENRKMETYLPNELPPNQLVLTNYRRINSTAFRETKTGHEINIEDISQGHKKFPAQTIAEVYKCSQEVFLINEHLDNSKINACLCAESDDNFLDILYYSLAVLLWMLFGLLTYQAIVRKCNNW